MIPSHVLDKYLEKEGITESPKNIYLEEWLNGIERKWWFKEYPKTPDECFELDVETALRYYSTSGIILGKSRRTGAKFLSTHYRPK